jgi:hypothetical protein
MMPPRLAQKEPGQHDDERHHDGLEVGGRPAAQAAEPRARAAAENLTFKTA